MPHPALHLGELLIGSFTMLVRRTLGLLLLWLALAASGFAHVKASLVSPETSIQPGRPFKVALRLEHEPHWHTYWINAGTGYATTIEWQLPEGWKAGPIEWPTPIVIRDRLGNVTGNGYEGEGFLPVTITPPANLKPGEKIQLRADAAWLMCAEVCIPGEAKVSLELPVSADAPRSDPMWKAKLDALPMPRPAEGWKVSALRRDAKSIVLLLAPGAGQNPTLQEPHFFAEDGYIQYDQKQEVRIGEKGTELTLPISAAADAPATRLVGVLATQKPLAGLRIDVPIEAINGGSAPPSGQPGAGVNGAPAKSSLPVTLVLAFLGGLILNLMPCVFPVLGIKILGFVNQSGSDRRKVTFHGLAFTAGVLICFWALAAFIAVLSASGDKIGWGAQLQYPAFVFGLAVVMLVFGLSMSGVFEFGLGATGVGASLQSKSGYAGSFFTGALATVVATPCSAPFLAPALGAALALPARESFAVFTAIGVGLSAPYLILSIFPQAVKMLPRPGAWMETFKQAMAFLLYGTVAWLVWVIAAQVSENGLLMMLFGLTAIAMGVWLYGRYSRPDARPQRPKFALIGGLALLFAGLWLGWPRDPVPTDVVWEKWSPEAVAKLKAEGRTIYVDFTARWCATCQTNKKIVFSSSEIKSAFREKNIATLKADWTNKDPQITAELAKFGRGAVPFNLVYKPAAAEPIILPELLTPGTVLDAVR